MNKSDFVNRIYSLARAKGLCKTQNEFAELLGMNKSTISSAINGGERSLTDNLIKRITIWAKQVGIEDDSLHAPAEDAANSATAKLYENLSESVRQMSETIRIQSETIKMQQERIDRLTSK